MDHARDVIVIIRLNLQPIPDRRAWKCGPGPPPDSFPLNLSWEEMWPTVGPLS